MELVPRDDPRVDALAAALGPYIWTRITPEMLARRVVGVLDRHWLLDQLPGVRPLVRLGDVEPAEPSDERVVVLIEALSTLRWRMLTRVALCRQLVNALERWTVRRRLVDIELSWLLDGGA
jgi:hypothetical protein